MLKNTFSNSPLTKDKNTNVHFLTFAITLHRQQERIEKDEI